MSHPSKPIGGVIHTYQKYDATKFPSPTQPPPDMVSSAFEHMLMYGSMRELTDEELARAIRIDPSQIGGLGPSIDALIAMLLERKRKILEKYETQTVQRKVRKNYKKAGDKVQPVKRLRAAFEQAFEEEQIYDLERIYYAAGDDTSSFARQLVPLIERLAEKYEIDELASTYEFTGHESMSVPQALAIKEELDKIEELLKQLAEARETAQIGIIDLDELAEFTKPGDIEGLQQMQEMVENYVREMAEQQGLQREGGAYQLTPKAHRLFQGKLLERIFDNLQAARSGRHQGPIIGEGAVEMQQTKPYEFGDSLTQMDIPQSMINAMIRQSSSDDELRFKSEDIEIHRTRNSPKCATVVIADMSGSMRQMGQYINVKRMALALGGLIRSEYPGDYLQVLEMFTFAKICPPGKIVELMPKPVFITDPFVQLKWDMSDENISETQIPPHFTNIQHALLMARQHLALQDTPNKQIFLITDGLPTAHFEEHMLYQLYPPHPRTEAATMREGALCQRDGITINIFLVPSWSQSEEDIRFAYRLAEQTTGRVIFTAGNDLDRFVIWDYVSRKREILA